MSWETDDQVSFVDLGIWDGKMSPAVSRPREERTSRPSSQKSSKSLSRTLPMCLCLRNADGQSPGASTMKWEDGALLTGFTTRSFGECPSVENASRLSQILEDCPHPKYSLSAKACQGILNRARRRGKKLPEILEAALIAQANTGGAISFQERAGKPGGGKGILIQDEHVGARSTLTNQSVLAFKQGNGAKARSIGLQEDCSPTLSSAESGTNQAPVICYGIGGYNSKGMLSPNPNSGIYEADTARTLDNNGGSPACNQGGMMIVQPICVEMTSTCGGDSTKANLVAAVDCRNGVEDPELNASLQSSAAHNLNSNNVLRQGGIVRRLTPLECERLQGFPDGWTDIGEWTDSKGKKHKPADSPRYKALGNSIAVGYANNKSGFWMWMLKRISAQYERAATLGSLFDGIGGFPLAWETFNGKGSAVWASEIEEFAIAVTKLRFPEEE